MKKKDLGVYIHYPFCERKCRYCDFCSSVGTWQEQNWYVRKLESEIQVFRALGNQYRIRTIFFGGGTPSLMDPLQMMRILLMLRDHFQVAEGVEITVECNPGTLTKEKLSDYLPLGINRLSIGLQSAHDEELKLLGRIHTWKEFLKNYETARELGFRNINVDLMQSLPGQSLESWQDTLGKVADLAPEHISAYALTLEEGTPFGQIYSTPEGRKQLPDEYTDRAMYHYTRKFLEGKGYHRYEISNYARDGFECRHNITYWTGGEYIGFGQSGASYLGGKRFANSRDPKEYRLQIPEAYARFKAQEPQSRQEAMEEFMFLGLRMTAGISEQEFERRFDASFQQVYGQTADHLAAQGLLTRKNGRVALTEFGVDVSNRVLSEFLL